MANLSNYIPVYVRTNGNDSSGDGSVGLPFATAQKAFEYIYNLINYGYGSSNNYVIDFGAGSFGGVNIITAQASEWPIHIAVRGIGHKQSFLGGINADSDDTSNNGYNIHIISNHSINLGNITSAGFYAENNATNGGNVYIEDCFLGNISANGAYSEQATSGAGGNITIINSIGDNIEANSGSSNGTMGSNGGAGTVILHRSEVKNISVNSGGSLSPGNGGSVLLYNSRAGDISSIGTNGYDGTPSGNGGHVLLDSSTANAVIARGGLDTITGDNGLKGNLVLVGVSIVPNIIVANVNAVALFQGHLVTNT